MTESLTNQGSDPEFTQVYYWKKRLMTHSIFQFYKHFVTSHSIVKIWKIPLKLLDIRYYKERELAGADVSVSISH